MEFVRVFNHGNAEAYENYMQANRAKAILQSAGPEQRKESFAQLVEMFGQFKIMSVAATANEEIRLLVSATRSEEQLEIVFGFVPDEEYRVQGIKFEPAGLAVNIEPGWEDLQSLLVQYTEATGVPAWAVAIIKNGEIIEQAAAGHHSLQQKRPVNVLHSRFHWGSVSKSMTATLIAALVEAGQLDWDTTIGEVFKGTPVLDAYRDVTVEQLLAHRSGIPPYDDFTSEFIQDINGRADSLQAGRQLWVRDVLTKEQPIFTPGSSHRYSNAGYTVAGVMAETLTGKSWEDLVKEYVLKPLAMTQSGFGWPADTEDSQQTRGHFGEAAEALQTAPTDALASLLVVTAPAGNMNSTIGDLAKYAQAHLNSLTGRTDKRKVLSNQSLLRLHQPLPAEQQRPEPYSAGWGQVNLPDGQAMHWHNGGAGSFYAEARLIPGKDLAVVIMANAGFAERAITPLWQALYQRYKD